MRRTFILAAIQTVASIHMALAQCPTPPLPGPEVMWLPEANNYLPDAIYGEQYEGYLKVFVPADSAYNLGGDWVTVDVIGFWLDSIVGLPEGFTFTPDPPEGMFAGGYPACIKFESPSSMPADIIGNHDITVHFTAEIDFGASTVYAFSHPIKLKVKLMESVDEGLNHLFFIDHQTSTLCSGPGFSGKLHVSLTDFSGRTIQSAQIQLNGEKLTFPLEGMGIVAVTMENGRVARFLKP